MKQEPMEPDFPENWLLRDDLGNAIPESSDVEVIESFVVEQGYEPPANDDLEPDHRWLGALRLVEAASVALAESQAKVEALQTQLEMHKTVSHEELQAVHAYLSLSRDETRRAYEDAARANNRALEAEAWLSRLSTAAHSGFGYLREDSRLRKLD